MKVTLQNLTKKYPSRSKKNPEEVVAVSDFTFEIPDGVLVGLLGPSGCGKSTTLNLLSGPWGKAPTIIIAPSMRSSYTPSVILTGTASAI